MFALAVPLASRLGLSAAAAVVAYVVLVVALSVVAVSLKIKPIGILAGPMSMTGFVEYCAPAQAVAFASRSSLAALPVMVESAERARLPPAASRVVLPLTLSVFHFGAAAGQTVGVVFLARLFDVTLTPLRSSHRSSLLSCLSPSHAVPGIPGGSVVVMVPGARRSTSARSRDLASCWQWIPFRDMFRTTANVTGAFWTLAAVLSPPRSRT